MNLRLAASSILLILLMSRSSLAAQRSCPQTTSDWQECERAVETQLIKEFPRLFGRDGPKLVLRYANSREELYADGEVEKDHESSYRGYVLIGYYSSIGYAVLRRWFYESSTVDLVNMRTGNHMDIAGVPVLSPSGTRVAVGWFEELVGRGSFAVYRINADDVTREFYEEMEGREVMDLRWIGDTSLSFVDSNFEPPIKKSKVLKGRLAANKTLVWKVE
jgi:hypothetical protein